MAEPLQPDDGYDYICQRCKHMWRARKPNVPPPAQCAKCRSAYWNRPKQQVVIVKGKKRQARVVIPPENDFPLEGHPLLQPPPHLRGTVWHPPEPELAPENTFVPVPDVESSESPEEDWSADAAQEKP